MDSGHTKQPYTVNGKEPPVDDRKPVIIWNGHGCSPFSGPVWPKEQTELLNTLQQLWVKHPHLTFTQLMWIVGKSEYMFQFVPDDYILKRAKSLLLKDQLTD